MTSNDYKLKIIRAQATKAHGYTFRSYHIYIHACIMHSLMYLSAKFLQ